MEDSTLRLLPLFILTFHENQLSWFRRESSRRFMKTLRLLNAVVTLEAGVQPGERLHLELTGFARKKLASVVASKEIES